MLFGTGLAFYLGKPLIQPQAPQLPAIPLGGWSDIAGGAGGAAGQSAVPHRHRAGGRCCGGASRSTRWGLLVRMAGDSASATRALGYSVDGMRIAATAAGGFIAGARRRVADAVLPGQLERRHLERPGPDRGGAGDLRALEPAALRRRGAAVRRRRRDRPGAAVDRRQRGYYLFNAVPYVLTLVILIITCRPGSVAARQPGRAVVTRNRSRSAS